MKQSFLSKSRLIVTSLFIYLKVLNVENAADAMIIPHGPDPGSRFIVPPALDLVDLVAADKMGQGVVPLASIQKNIDHSIWCLPCFTGKRVRAGIQHIF